MLVVAKTFKKKIASIIALESRNCRLLENNSLKRKGEARGAEAPVASSDILVAGTLSAKWGPPQPAWHSAIGF